MRWQPYVTVAAVIEDQGRFLLVKEKINNEIVYNQPAGHWEENETLIEAAQRETLEETGWHFRPRFLLGIYQWQLPDQSKTYLRFAFAGDKLQHEANRTLDKEIIETVWLYPEEIKQLGTQLRSPQVLLCIEDYLSGQNHSLEMMITVNNE